MVASKPAASCGRRRAVELRARLADSHHDQAVSHQAKSKAKAKAKEGAKAKAKAKAGRRDRGDRNSELHRQQNKRKIARMEAAQAKDIIE